MEDLVDEIENQTSGITQHQRRRFSISSGSDRELMSSVGVGIHGGTLNVSSPTLPQDRENSTSSARNLRNYQAHVSSEDEEHMKVVSRPNSRVSVSGRDKIRRRPDTSYDNYVKAEGVEEFRPTNRRSQYENSRIPRQNRAHDMDIEREFRVVQPEQLFRRKATQNRRRIGTGGKVIHIRRASSRERFHEQPHLGRYMEPPYRSRVDRSPSSPPGRPRPSNYERQHERSRFIYPEEDSYVTKYDRFGAEPDFESLHERNSEEEWDSKEDWDFDAFLFTLSGHAKVTTSEDKLLDTDIFETLEKEGTESLSKLAAKPTGVQSRGKMYHVVQSRYTGEGLEGGVQTAEMTVTHGQKSETDQIPLFRWIEFVDTHMNFRDFEVGVASVIGLSGDQKAAMIEMLSTVQKTLDKRINIAGGKEAGYMTPGSLLKDLDPDLPHGSSAKRRVAWKCLPYFSLEAYHDNNEASSDSHPSRTLLQTRFSDNKRVRDMQQAVCHLPNVKSGFCFHIAQVWCLLLNNSLLITCSNLPLMSSNSQKGLCNNAISLAPLNHPLNSKNTATGTILILTYFNVTYSLPLKDCETWLDFISHLWELWSCYFQVMFKGKRVTSDNWPKLVTFARKGGLVLLLDDRKPNTKGLGRGILLEEEDSDPQALGIDPNDKPTGVTYQEPSEQDAATSSTMNASNDETEARAVPSLAPSKEKLQAHIQSPVPRQAVKTDRQSQGGMYSFHAFIWLNSEKLISGGIGSHTDKKTLSTDEIRLRTDLEEISVFLSKKAGTTNRHAFKSCPSQSRREVHNRILNEVNNISRDYVVDQRDRQRFENKVEIWNILSKLFQFFLPHNFEGPTTDKFWGAVAQILDLLPPQKEVRSTTYLDEGKITEIIDMLKKITGIIEPFLNYIQLISVTNLIGKECPEEIPRAWAHLLMFLILSSTNDTAGFSRQSKLCLKMLENGMQSIAQGMSSKKLEDSRVFGPLEMVNLMHLQLLKDYTPNSVDISETYRQYLNKLESAMDENPLDRRHQRSLDYLLEEIAAIETTISEQRATLADNQESRQTLPDKSVKLEWEQHSTDKIGLSLIYDRVALINRRLDEFQKMREKVLELKNLNTQKIEINKDGQEKAIYAFTVVTIIFLPLGTVAGILGMNTTDVRNMNQSQWVFWATALPLTVIVIVLCLLWTGTTDSFWNEARKLWPRRIPWPNISVSMGKTHSSYGRSNSRQDSPIREAEARMESQIEWLKDRKKNLRASQPLGRDVRSGYESYDRLDEYDERFQRGAARRRAPFYPVQSMVQQHNPVQILEPQYSRRYTERNQRQDIERNSPRMAEMGRRRRKSYINADGDLNFHAGNRIRPEDEFEWEETMPRQRQHFSPPVTHARNLESNPDWRY